MIEACLAPVLIEGTPGGLDFLSGRREFSDADGGLVGQTILGVTTVITRGGLLDSPSILERLLVPLHRVFHPMLIAPHPIPAELAMLRMLLLHMVLLTDRTRDCREAETTTSDIHSFQSDFMRIDDSESDFLLHDSA